MIDRSLINMEPLIVKYLTFAYPGQSEQISIELQKRIMMLTRVLGH